MGLQSNQALFARNVAKLIEYIFSKKYECTLGDAFRSKEQAELNAAQGIGIVNSLHCKRLAIDLNLFDVSGRYLTHSEDYELFGIYWESLHPSNRWGGNFKKPDGCHFEMNV